MRVLRVYVAGPYTHPDPVRNVRAAIDAGNQIMDLGHAPFVPHLNYAWDLVHPRPYEDWIRWCLNWVGACSALVRLPGESPGADREVELARNLLLPVFEGPGWLGELRAYGCDS